MGKRISDKRLAEIEDIINGTDVWPAEKYFRELLGAIKAERVRCDSAEESLSVLRGTIDCYALHLEMAMKRARRLPDKWRNKISDEHVLANHYIRLAINECADELEATLK